MLIYLTVVLAVCSGRFRAPPPPHSSASSSPVSSCHGSDSHSPTKEAIPAPLPAVFFHACNEEKKERKKRGVC